MHKKWFSAICFGWVGMIGSANAELYDLMPKNTQCYMFRHNQLQAKVACKMTGKASTGKVWWTRRNFVLQNGQRIDTLAKDTKRKYLAKGDKILMPITPDGKPAEDLISIATLNNQPAIRQNRLLRDYHVMSQEEFWGEQSELLPNTLTDRLACLQVQDKSVEICTPYADNDFRTD